MSESKSHVYSSISVERLDNGTFVVVAGVDDYGRGQSRADFMTYSEAEAHAVEKLKEALGVVLVRGPGCE